MKIARYVRSLRQSLPAETARDFDLTLEGDADAVVRLLEAIPVRLRGHLAVVAYQLSVPNPVYQMILGEVWRLNESLLTEFWPSSMVRRMLARAEFDVPNFLGRLSVYRGFGGERARRMTAKRAASELFWYCLRPSAERSAIGAPGTLGTVKVFRISIARADIIYWGEGNGEIGVVANRVLPAVRDEDVSEIPLLRRAAVTQ